MASISESTSSSLLRRVRDDDQDAWARLVQLYGPLVYAWARRIGINSEDAADIGQEVFRVVAARMSEFRRDAADQSFRGWLWVICRHKIGDFLRSNHRHENAAGGSGSLIGNLANSELPKSWDESSDARDHHALFAAALRLIQTDFEEHTWKAFWMTVIEEHPVAQIAEELGMNAKAIRQAKYRVLKRLREEFGDLLN